LGPEQERNAALLGAAADHGEYSLGSTTSDRPRSALCVVLVLSGDAVEATDTPSANGSETVHIDGTLRNLGFSAVTHEDSATTGPTQRVNRLDEKPVFY